MKLEDKVIVITGAGSGIGRALAQAFAQAGCDLALSDINEQGLEETVANISKANLNITTHCVDVADRAAVELFAIDVMNQHQQIDIVINNAGVQASGNIEDIAYDDFEWLMNINMWGVVYGCKAFLPYLKQRPEACLVNIASLNSFMPFEQGGPYNMAKSAVLGLSETLMLELHETNVNVLSVHPGGIQTNIANNARNVTQAQAKTFNSKLATTADSAAAQIVKAVAKQKSWLFIGWDAKFLAGLKRICPSLALKASKVIMGNVIKGDEAKA
jgi:NAD(P)-dependent dehydrogenase (short-subunit alcohol dehydrogenase family)